VGESYALSCALVMALAATPRERFSHKEIDALCQVAYELQEKLTKALEMFQGLCHVAERGTQKGLRAVSPQATAARQVSIAAARKPRCVDAEVR
jgi:hypothetical protein